MKSGSSREVEQGVHRFLGEHMAMTLATEDQGAPWASILFYVSDGTTLYFMTEPYKRLAVNIARNPRVAASVVEEAGDLSHSQGIQLEGVAEAVTSPREGLKARAILLKKLAALGTGASLGSRISPEALRRLTGAQLYRVRIQRLWFTDNTQGLGHRTELAAGELEPKGGARP